MIKKESCQNQSLTPAEGACSNTQTYKQKANVSLAWFGALIKTVKLSFSKLYNYKCHANNVK